MRKKIIIMLLTITMLLGLFAGCGKTNDNSGNDNKNVEESVNKENPEEGKSSSDDNDTNERLLWINQGIDGYEKKEPTYMFCDSFIPGVGIENIESASTRLAAFIYPPDTIKSSEAFFSSVNDVLGQDDIASDSFKAYTSDDYYLFEVEFDSDSREAKMTYKEMFDKGMYRIYDVAANGGLSTSALGINEFPMWDEESKKYVSLDQILSLYGSPDKIFHRSGNYNEEFLGEDEIAGSIDELVYEYDNYVMSLTISCFAVPTSESRTATIDGVTLMPNAYEEKYYDSYELVTDAKYCNIPIYAMK